MARSSARFPIAWRISPVRTPCPNKKQTTTTTTQSRQHPQVFPGGPPPQYEPGPAPLNFGGRGEKRRGGGFKAVGPYGPCIYNKKPTVALVTCARGICIPLKPAIPPLTAQCSFACSVASLSQCPHHHLPGHCSLRRADPAGCHLGQDRPSTWNTARNTVPNTAVGNLPRG